MLTERLASFVCETPDVPEQVMRGVKVALIDTLGVALAGTEEIASQLAFEYVQAISARPQATLWGQDSATSCADAAFVNAIAAHALDFDDTQANLRGHPSTTMIPVALAVGEMVGASGRDVLTAYALGLEVAGKLGKALGNGHYLRGWHSTATIGVFASTAVACRLLGRSAIELCHAWGIAAAQSAGVVRNFGTMTKAFQAGHSAHSAVLAASLAGRGFTADDHIFDNDNSFLATYAGDGEKLPTILERLGNPWEMLDPGMNFKRWPCCYCSHRAIGGLLELLALHSITSDEIETVRIGFPPGSDEPLIYDDPTTALEGKFSIQYAVAATVLNRRLGLDSFTDAAVNRPEVRQMMKRVQRYRVPDDKVYSGTIGYTDIDISTIRGVFYRRVDKAPGSPAWPMSAADHEEKFLDCASRVLSGTNARTLLDLSRRCEELPEVRMLTQAMKSTNRHLSHRVVGAS